QKWFWVGVGSFILTLLPQVVFDLKHEFIMSKSVIRHLSESSGTEFNIVSRFQEITLSFYNTFLATLMNHKIFTLTILILSLPLLYGFFKEKKKETPVLVSVLFIFIPFLGYLILPVNVNPWHLGGEMAVSIILIAYLFKQLLQGVFFNKTFSAVLSILLIWYGVSNISNFFIKDFGRPNLDPSLYKNEISAIDYVYQKAKGQNFKVYTFMPSVYDYPYQYLFWWYGRKKYGFIPMDYAYAPNKPQYIGSKGKFEGSKDNYGGLVFLIKEPNRGHDWKSGWEADYRFMDLLSAEKLGVIEVEIRRE
ncbi:MAG: hypothetical protein Q8Q86_02645, partial [Candidatus Daviesbacteria bacterium]|nr:hypothetical protein [Candidatus Daviesbacteria bacterium]